MLRLISRLVRPSAEGRFNDSVAACMGEGTSYGPYLLDHVKYYARETKSKPAAALAPSQSGGSVKIVLLQVIRGHA